MSSPQKKMIFSQPDDVKRNVSTNVLLELSASGIEQYGDEDTASVTLSVPIKKSIVMASLNPIHWYFITLQEITINCLLNNLRLIKKVCLLLPIVVYFIFLIVALVINFKDAQPLLNLTIFIVICVVIYNLYSCLLKNKIQTLVYIRNFRKEKRIIIRIILYVTVSITIIGLLIFDRLGTRYYYHAMVSALGLLFLIFLCSIFSNNVSKQLPTIIFLSFVVSILNYYGITHRIVKYIGIIFKHTLETTPCESTNAIANIFFSGGEAVIFIAPYLPVLTKSELHCVMSNGFATLSPGIIALYINFGIDAKHLLAATVISLPASIVAAKLLYPETEQTSTDFANLITYKSLYDNVIDAAADGILKGVTLIVHLAANIIAVLSCIRFLDILTNWAGDLVGYKDISLEYLVAFIFYPMSLLFGVPINDAELISQLISRKIVYLDSFAYKNLADWMKNKRFQEDKAVMVAIYVLCGYGSLTEIGIQLGNIAALSPQRREEAASMSIRAMMSGIVACFFTACVAGMIYKK